MNKNLFIALIGYFGLEAVVQSLGDAAVESAKTQVDCEVAERLSELRQWYMLDRIREAETARKARQGAF